MDPQDYTDSSDESDLDYKPPGEAENLSEIDSDDPIEDDDNVANTSTRKSKKIPKRQTNRQRSAQKKIKKIEVDDEITEKTKEDDNILPNSSEEDKKRLDSLWEEFQRPIVKKSTLNTSQNKSKLKETTKVSDKLETTKKRNFEDIFDTADSLKKVENNEVTTVPTSSATPVVKKLSGGLSNVLSQLGKKSKLTVLEKSKQDWDGYKQKEGIVEELITYNKGKDGYLEKQDFLERTDLRQFELEKAMRDANRSRRN